MKVFRRFIKGILLKGESSDPTDNQEGSIWTNSTTSRIKSYIEGAVRTLVSEDQTQTLTNKSIDADNNPISNVDTTNLRAGVLVTDVSTASADTELPSALAVKTALEAQNEADEITYDPSGSSLVATDVQAAIDENDTNIQNHISDAADAHAASAVTNTPSGNLTATDAQAALNELQTDVDTRALASDLSDHISDPTDAHAASAITNTPSGNLAATDTQGAVNELQGDIDSINTTVSGKADTDLNNLASVDLNQNLTTTKASALQLSHTTVNQDVDVLTANNGAGDSGDINLTPGTATGTRGDINLLGEQKSTVNINSPIWWATSGIPGIVLDLTTTAATNAFAAAIVAEGSVNDADFFIQTQDQDAGTAGSANMYITTGWNSNTGSTGNLELYTGNQSGASGNTGAFSFETGQSSNGNSGSVNTKTGQANNGTSGSYSISTGNSTAGTTGDINITTGTTAGTRGDVIFNTNKIDMTGSTELDVTGVTVTGLPAAGANIQLSNLGTTALGGSNLNGTGNISPDGLTATKNLGTSSKHWLLTYSKFFISNVAGGYFGSDFNTGAAATFQSGQSNSAAATANVTIQSGDQLNFGSGTVGDVTIESGQIFEATNTNDTGNVIIKTGTTAGSGARGKIQIQDGSEGTSGHVLASIDTNGTLGWIAPASGGATTELDNLGVTDLNASLFTTSGVNIGTTLAGQQFGQINGTAIQAIDGANGGSFIIRTHSGGEQGGFKGFITSSAGISGIGITNRPIAPRNVIVMTGNNATADAVATSDISIATGNKTAGTGDSGDLNLRTGTSVGGTRGSIVLETNKLDATAVTEGVGLPVWKKVTVAATAFTAAANSEDIELLSLPAGAAIHSVVIKHSAKFDDNGNTAFTLSVGVSGDLTKYASAFDVWQNPGNTIAQTTSVFDVEDFGSATSIRLAAVSTGQTLDNVTLGSVDVYVLMSTLPV